MVTNLDDGLQGSAFNATTAVLGTSVAGRRLLRVIGSLWPKQCLRCYLEEGHWGMDCHGHGGETWRRDMEEGHGGET